jgi:hypothetical protein
MKSEELTEKDLLNILYNYYRCNMGGWCPTEFGILTSEQIFKIIRDWRIDKNGDD